MAAGMHARVQQSARAPTVARLEPLMVVMVEDERHDDADRCAVSFAGQLQAGNG